MRRTLAKKKNRARTRSLPLKQEMRCNASKSSEGNTTRSLSCNEECARLERNRKLALALHIDPATHVEGGDHIPYSTETLNLFQEHPKWSQMQEREFRVFAASDDEKRLRFKPMTPPQRAFMHHLAEDFGFDSESMDPEPHRHVVIFKTPKFVAAPNKTIADCVRIRASQRAAAGTTSDTERKTKNKASNEAGEPYNSFLISSPRFGLTVEEVRAELASVLPSSSPITFDIEFLPSEEVVLKATPCTLSEQNLDRSLQELRPVLAAAIAAKALGKLDLARTDNSLNVLRRESDPAASDGWSRVAAKGAAPRRLDLQVGIAGSNTFSALGGGGKVTFAKRKPEKKPKVKRAETVVEDWEEAVRAEEERERSVSGISEGEERLERTTDDEGGAVLKVVDPATLGETNDSLASEGATGVEGAGAAEAGQPAVAVGGEVRVPTPVEDNVRNETDDKDDGVA
ncbi:FKBP12-associated protein [Elasticomyces elasticus]|nr:FKBP12-associated protein [Elasticomyces elasticus]